MKDTITASLIAFHVPTHDEVQTSTPAELVPK
ncbi:Uncharacterised protein [Mycoplasmopsis synoviae]|uniref:Uncharacterized protein n=1 Tax=Mycoplasmopsis synoviae TaxID=2109 RepID=A0A3B0PTQ3_MYCSY|nr:Uncharacterised protein [Mycoplasmopsis synoviae]